MLCERRRGDGAHLHCLLSCTLAFMDLEDDHDEDDDDTDYKEEIKQVIITILKKNASFVHFVP